MKKITFFLLTCFLLLLTACGNTDPKIQYTEIGLTQEIDLTAIVLAETDSVAIHVRTMVPMVGFSLKTSTPNEQAELHVACYAYRGTYEETVAKKPLESYTFSEIGPNETELSWQFRPLEAGDYLIVLTAQHENVLLKQSAVPSFAANGKLELFRNGMPSAGGICDLKIFFDADSTESAVFFGSIVSEPLE